jgi:hypothetical protein
MNRESEKYDRLLQILRNSKPRLDSTDQIEKNVIRKILKSHQRKLTISDVINFLFGWAYIGWVRRSLITASVILVIIFVYQQAVILRQIGYLSHRIILIDDTKPSLPTVDIQKQLMMYKLSGKIIKTDNFNISSHELKQLLKSVDELQDQYRDLIDVINSDPALKKYIEQKLSEKNKSKTNL